MSSSPAASSPDPTFADFIREHQGMVWRYLRFLGCSADQANDLTQDTFLAVVDKPVHRFGDDGARAYLRRVARNGWLKYRQRLDRRGEVDLDVGELAYEWYRRADEGESTMAALRQCLEQLPERARNALQLRYGEGLDRDGLAQRLGLGVEGVKSVLARGMARLRACIERRLRDDLA